MHHHNLVMLITTFTSLFFLTTLAAIFLDKIRFPYTIGLVVIGIILGLFSEHSSFLQPLFKFHLTTDLILYLLLPILIFDAAINIELPSLLKDLAPILILAIPGVALATLIVGGVLHGLTPISWAGALIFGALISATDPVAVIALFKEIGAPKRITLLMDAESLFNDATAIVAFTIVSSLFIGTTQINMHSFLHTILQFCWVFFGGIAVGAVLGFALLFMTKISREMPYVQLAHSTILAYSSFLVANHLLGMSGIMSTIAAGIVTRQGMHRVLHEQAKTYLFPYWEFMAFVSNSFIFLLLGLQEKTLIHMFSNLPHSVQFIVWSIIAVLFARFIIIYLLIPITNRFSKAQKIDAETKLLMFWGGLRGVIPVALMLDIPDSFPEKDLIITITLSVILFSLLIQGATIEKLIHLLKKNKGRSTSH